MKIMVSTIAETSEYCTTKRGRQPRNASSITTTSAGSSPCQQVFRRLPSSSWTTSPSSDIPSQPLPSLIVRLKISSGNIALLKNLSRKNSSGHLFCKSPTSGEVLEGDTDEVLENAKTKTSSQIQTDIRNATARKSGRQAKPVNYNEDTELDTMLFDDNKELSLNTHLAPELSSQKRKRVSHEQEEEDDLVPKRPQQAKSKTRHSKLRRKDPHISLSKPSALGGPLVWAEKRQQLCEALPYYIAYQSGAYTHDGIVKGFLCDKFVSLRDKFTDEVMICRVGGGRAPDGNGDMVQARDQNVSPVALALLRTMDLHLPVAIIVGSRNPICPVVLPHYYCVLDWFHVTDVWCEIINRFKVWMVRFEKIDLSKRSWWSRSNDSISARQSCDFNTTRVFASCITCRRESKMIYNDGWTCQNNQCVRFFQFAKKYDPRTLDYTTQFLNERTNYIGEDPGPLNPPLLTEADMATTDAFGIEKQWKRGIVCPLCGCCSRRIKWDHWFCENPDCDFTHRVQQRPTPIGEVVTRSLGCEATDLNPTIKGGIRVGQSIKGLYDVYEYIIPGLRGEDIGCVRHFKGNGIINQQPDGPNDLFLAMQQDDLGLKRNPARLPGLPGEILTSHWAANWGAPYKYGVTVLSKGFDEAPAAIIKALKRLTWAGQQAVTDNFDPFQPFNELLSIGYFEGTAIGYHDDGEYELGPTVATLSLGSAATMSFRPKSKNSLGVDGGRRNAVGTKPDVLKITLEHGDLVVMHGRDIQKLYEHAVTPHGKLRFALTCRYIRPELLSETDREIAAAKSTIPSKWDNYVYDGDINAKISVPDSKKDEAETVINTLRAKIKVGEVDAEQLAALRELLTS